jgi:SAM-dependent methyltransferase
MDLKDYYKNYYNREGDQAYTMEAQGSISRVLQIIDWIISYVPKGGKILDVGCGDMFLSTRSSDYDWTGIDINITKAKGKAIEHDLMESPYPFPDASFDAILCSETLEHVWDPRIVHKEANRLLKKDGIYIVTTPNFNWLDHYLAGFQHLLWDPENRPHTSEHIRQYNYVVHETHLRKDGFTPIDFTGADAHYSFFLQDARKYLKMLLGTQLGHKEFLEDGRVDMVIGRMLPLFNHTICVVSRKV